VTSPRRFAVLLLLAAAVFAGCFTWDAWAPDQSPPDPDTVTPSRAVHLMPGESSSGSLDCKSGRCDQWFRVRVDESGVLRVEARIEGLAERAVARLFLQDGTGRTLASARSSEGLPLRVEGIVEPGPYAVLLQAGGGPLVYTVETGPLE
jgi:hypothetical protein